MGTAHGQALFKLVVITLFESGQQLVAPSESFGSQP